MGFLFVKHKIENPAVKDPLAKATNRFCTVNSFLFREAFLIVFFTHFSAIVKADSNPSDCAKLQWQVTKYLNSLYLCIVVDFSTDSMCINLNSSVCNNQLNYSHVCVNQDQLVKLLLINPVDLNKHLRDFQYKMYRSVY